MNKIEVEARRAGRERAIREFQDRVAKEEYERTLRELEQRRDTPSDAGNETPAERAQRIAEQRDKDRKEGRRFWDEHGDGKALSHANRLYQVQCDQGVPSSDKHGSRNVVSLELAKYNGKLLTLDELKRVIIAARGTDRPTIVNGAIGDLWSYRFIEALPL